MIKKTINSLNFYFFENLSKYKEIFHFVTTKPLNLSFIVGEDRRKVLQNRKKIASALNISLDNFVFMKQVHGKNIAVITEKEKGRGSMDFESAIESTDAMVTNIPNICINIMAADCVPILMYDPVQKVVVAVHAGKKGTELEIAKEAVKALKEKFNSNPRDLIIGLGPAIGPCHYEVDLWSENKNQLVGSGVREENIEVFGLCTVCHNTEFFSARKENEKSGRFISGIMLRI